MKTVLFACTGNTCRSPMAEMIVNHARSDWRAWSERATGGTDTACQNALDALTRKGFPASALVRNAAPQPVSFDLVVAIDSPRSSRNWQELSRRLPGVTIQPWKVTDPVFQNTSSAYDDTYTALAAQIGKLP